MRDRSEETRETRPDRDFPENWTPAATPFQLAPQDLRDEHAREVRPVEIRPTEAAMVSFGDRGASEVRPAEHRYEFVETVAAHLELRPEHATEISMLEIPLTGFQMRTLQERRVSSRDLGWRVPGVRIRID